MSLLSQVLSLPGQLLLTLLSMVGLAAWPRQIVRVVPRAPGVLNYAKSARRVAEGYTVSRWIADNVPSLKGTFKPAWWLPK